MRLRALQAPRIRSVKKLPTISGRRAHWRYSRLASWKAHPPEAEAQAQARKALPAAAAAPPRAVRAALSRTPAPEVRRPRLARVAPGVGTPGWPASPPPPHAPPRV